MPHRLTEEVFAAGRVMATLLEADIQACGNAPPHAKDCGDCRPQREAIVRWMRACWAAQQPQLTPSETAAALLAEEQKTLAELEAACARHGYDPDAGEYLGDWLERRLGEACDSEPDPDEPIPYVLVDPPANEGGCAGDCRNCPEEV